MHERLNDFELRLRRDLHVSTDQTDAAATLVSVADKLSADFEPIAAAKSKLDELTKSTLSKSHPRAQAPIAEMQKNVQIHWEQVEALRDEKIAAVQDLHAQLTEHDKAMKQLDEFTKEQTDALRQTNEKCDQTWSLPEIQE